MVRPWRVLGKASFYFLPDVMFHKESVILGLQGCCQSRQLSRWAHTCIVQLVAEVGVFHAIYGQSALATKVTATRFLVQQPPATTHQLNNKHISLATSGYHGVTDWSLGLCDWGINCFRCIPAAASASCLSTIPPPILLLSYCSCYFWFNQCHVCCYHPCSVLWVAKGVMKNILQQPFECRQRVNNVLRRWSWNDVPVLPQESTFSSLKIDFLVHHR